MKYPAKLKTFIASIVVLSTIFAVSSCDYLDVVPDNVATEDDAFSLRNEAEKYLFSIYSYLPRNGDHEYNIGMMAGDELWIPYEKGNVFSFSVEIARGNQRVSQPYQNVWVGSWDGGGPDDNYRIYEGIRLANNFINKLQDPNQVRDMSPAERTQWIGEAQFLKAYFHFYLMRMYGPIPIIDENVSVDASENAVAQTRKPVDEVVEFVVTLLDTAATKLPNVVQDASTELGRITEPIARGVKAKVLLTAASPLFNGNTDFAGFTNDEGTPYFNQEYAASKWQAASDAALEAIERSELNHSLYNFPGSSFELSDTTLTKLSIRQALSDRWNPEIIWGLSNSRTYQLQLHSMMVLDSETIRNNVARGVLSAPLEIARMFYTSNGVPITEDNSLDYTDETEILTAGADHRYNILEGYRTARLNFDREPRFYADLAFDGSTFYKRDSPSNSDENTFHVEAKFGQYAGAPSAFYINSTGYFPKKLIEWTQSFGNSGVSYQAYPWPQMRLAELYLMYAEAENEANGPSPQVYQYMDLVRERAGLEGVVESWSDHSVNPSKPTTKEGLREIIHQERLIELAFEGKRYWDFRRWKTANEELNENITGWNIFGSDAESYYQVSTVYRQEFVAPRDYLWPLQENTLLQNPSLDQNPGW
jgi:hypothetical protein